MENSDDDGKFYGTCENCESTTRVRKVQPLYLGGEITLCQFCEAIGCRFLNVKPPGQRWQASDLSHSMAKDHTTFILGHISRVANMLRDEILDALHKK